MEKNKPIEEWMAELSTRFEQHASTETKAILDQVRNGDLDIEEAMQLLTQQIFKNPTQIQHLYSIATDMQIATPNPKAKLYQPPVGLPRLDPEYEADLHERLQFDEDAPELRFEGKPADVEPAVPVADAPLSPIALGKALKQASEKVAQDFKELVDTKGKEGVYLPTMTQPDSYPVGQIPQNVPVKSSGLVLLSKEDEQLFAWKSISTTQGRRSLVEKLQAHILRELNTFGYQVTEGVFNPHVKDKAVVAQKWDISVLGSGPKSTNENFSYFHTAATALSLELRRNLQAISWDADQPLKLFVSTWDQYSDRQFGWVAFLSSEDGQ